MSSPRGIVNNFRLQTLIEKEIAVADAMTTKNNLEQLSSHDLVNLMLTYLEIGDWKKVDKYATAAQQIEAIKPTDQQDKEVLATVSYALGTKSRELNDCEKAHEHLNQASLLAKSDWLKSNIYRNRGLIYLKQKKFAAAAAEFKQGLDLASQDNDLRGSLPALFNYYALSTTRAALQLKEASEIGLQLFQETTTFYQTIFAEKKIEAGLQLKSHDWQSHQYHRGMVLCEIAELQNNKDINCLHEAESLLLGSLAGRKANRADNQRLGDVNVWLGRVYVCLNDTVKARAYFTDALKHFRLAFQKPALQVLDVSARLLSLPPVGAASTKQSTFTPALVLPAAPLPQDDLLKRNQMK